ncbi:MAG TPA: hypothetical protein VGN17_10660 [Bryobacteraceae bacterium]|jgi:hypothetical protein
MNDSICCSLATTPEERNQVYRMRYACYRRDEAIEARADESFSDSYDDMPNHFSFLARAGQAEPLGTVRISVVRPEPAWETAPSHKVFGDNPEFQRIAGGTFVEASRLCFGVQARRDALMRVIAYLAALADFYQAEWLVACPRVEHSQTYERLFGFVRIAEPRQYLGVKFKTTLLAVPRAKLIEYTSGTNSRATKTMDAARLEAFAHIAAASPLSVGHL